MTLKMEAISFLAVNTAGKDFLKFSFTAISFFESLQNLLHVVASRIKFQ